jgi:hypothetical protein
MHRADEEQMNPPNPPPTGGENGEGKMPFKGGEKAPDLVVKNPEKDPDQELVFRRRGRRGRRLDPEKKNFQYLFQKFIQDPLFKDPRLVPQIFWRKQKKKFVAGQ